MCFDYKNKRTSASKLPILMFDQYELTSVGIFQISVILLLKKRLHLNQKVYGRELKKEWLSLPSVLN
ncbi:hypothetical protein D3C87_06750 [compost metagenome]